MTCPKCNGVGKIVEPHSREGAKDCPKCGGSGQVTADAGPTPGDGSDTGEDT